VEHGHIAASSHQSSTIMRTSDNVFIGAAFICCCLLLHGGSGDSSTALYAQERTPESSSDTTRQSRPDTTISGISDTTKEHGREAFRTNFMAGAAFFETGKLNDIIAARGFPRIPSVLWWPPMFGFEGSMSLRPGGPSFDVGFFIAIMHKDYPATDLIMQLAPFAFGFDIFQRDRISARVQVGAMYGLTHARLTKMYDGNANSQPSDYVMALDAQSANLIASLEVDYALGSYSSEPVARNILLGLRIGGTAIGLTEWQANGISISGDVALKALPLWYMTLVYSGGISIGD
jgi:hypothetical protein